MGAFAPCGACGETANVEYACPYCLAPPVRGEDAAADAATPAAVATESRSVARDQAVRLIDYRSTYGTGIFLQLLLGLFVLFAAWSLYTARPYLAALRQVRDGVFTGTSAEFLRIEDAYLLASTFAAVLMLLVVVVWIVWFYRSYKNLDALGRTRSHKAWWAIFGWILPVVNLFRPRQIAGELWVESRMPDPAPSLLEWHPEPATPWFFNAWWAAHLLAGLIAVLGPGYFNEPTIEGYYGATRWEFASYLALLAAAPLAVLVVRSINLRQQLLAHSLDVRMGTAVSR